MIVIMLAAQLPIASSYSCVEQCRSNLSAAMNQCNQQNTNYLMYQMVNVCINEAHVGYRTCLDRCPQDRMGLHRLPEEQVQPLPGYMPGTY
jgi:hypothetical protein